MTAPGPIDVEPWPGTLTAHVVTSGEAPRVHGYDVEADLARHYRHIESVFLALTGELPEDAAGAALDVVAHFVAPASVATAPVHAAALVRLCGGDAGVVLASAAVGLAEETRARLEAHQPLIDWLDSRQGELPAMARAEDGDAASVERLRQALGRSPYVTALRHDMSRMSAVLAILYATGLRTVSAMATFLVWARLPFATAEALSVGPGGFRDYPSNLPPMRYEERNP